MLGKRVRPWSAQTCFRSTPLKTPTPSRRRTARTAPTPCTLCVCDKPLTQAVTARRRGDRPGRIELLLRRNPIALESGRGLQRVLHDIDGDALPVVASLDLDG